MSARSRSRRLSEADTEPRLGVGRQKSLLQCCQHQLFVSDATIFDIGGFAKTTCILFCCITIWSALRPAHQDERKKLARLYYFGTLTMECLPDDLITFVSKSSIQASRVPWAMLGHCSCSLPQSGVNITLNTDCLS